jgi:FkbM family methyltransferase
MNITPQDITSVTFTKVLDTFYIYTGDKLDRYVQLNCSENGVWDAELTQWMINNIQPGWTCLDIGANTFYFAEVMARLAGQDGRILAFEPIKRLCNEYYRARCLNDYTNTAPIEVFEFALSAKEDILVLKIWEENVGASSITGSFVEGMHGTFGNYKLEGAVTKRLDSIDLDRIDFIKIDIEGHERFAFEGFSEAAKQCPLIVIELGYGQPDYFLEDIESKYTMEFLNGNHATIEEIKKHDVVNILLKNKQT